ncbi:hypothetical protein BJY01DRAFT_248033 [Aspergillus pseudoustus]|uniref:Transcription factor domain-containing protein n=1 Tax=Aspergillus pseudoustus TaxID=1810923 RepID=A0ABR4K0T1_9EURO
MELESRIDSILSSAQLHDCAGEGVNSTSASFASIPVDSPSALSYKIQQHQVVNSVVKDIKSSIQSWLDDDLTPYLDKHATETIFRRYVTDMAPSLPVVVFPPGTTGSDIRKENPILFLSILDVASSGFCALEIERKIRKLIVQTYVHCMLRSEQYTLGLLQALIVSATWYRTIEPVEPGEQMDIYQISHTAANMALIMRLGESLNAKSWWRPMFPRTDKAKEPESTFHAESLEARRAWLGCHYICSNTSMSLQAPNVMRWTRTMDECLQVLENSPSALSSDKVLCAHIRLQHITEEFAMQLSAEETSSPVMTRATQRQVTHRASKQQLSEWYTNAISDTWDGSLEFSYHFSRLYISEVAHCTEISEGTSCESSPPMIAVEPQALTEFMDIIDNILRVFSSLDMAAIRALPAFYLIRIIYTFLILAKLHFAATKLPVKNALISVNRLQVSQRLDHVLQRFAGWGPLWPATKLTAVFLKMRASFQREEENGNQQRLQRADSCHTRWLFKHTSSHSQDASDTGSMVATDSQTCVPSLASTDVNTLPSWVEPLLATDVLTGLCSSNLNSGNTEDYFVLRDASGSSFDCGIPPTESHAGSGLGDILDIALDNTSDMHLDWSQFSNMNFDLPAPFSPGP